MKRPAATILTSVALLLPVLSAFGHLDAQLGSSFEEREIIVTGHVDPDATLHIEAVSGVLHLSCAECVLEKRRSGVEDGIRPVVTLRPTGPRLGQDGPVAPARGSVRSGPARAPPLV